MHEDVLTMIEREVLSWPGVSKETRGTAVTPGIDVTIYWLGRRQIGHIHHDGVVDLQFPKVLHDELIATYLAALDIHQSASPNGDDLRRPGSLRRRGRRKADSARGQQEANVWGVGPHAANIYGYQLSAISYQRCTGGIAAAAHAPLIADS